VEQWSKERPDLELSALAVLGRLFRIAHLAGDELGRGLEGFDLQPGWFDQLAALRRAGDPFELNPTQLMRSTMLSSGGMTKRIDQLAAAGLVERRPDPTDRRGTLVRLTRRGRRLIDAAIDVHLANERAILSSLKVADRRELDSILRTLLASLDASD
jgi:DNA-binding MarR family transcriptional regulator